MSITGILVTCIIGLVVGAIAKLLMPGKDPGGCIITMLLGIAGAWRGAFEPARVAHCRDCRYLFAPRRQRRRHSLRAIHTLRTCGAARRDGPALYRTFDVAVPNGRSPNSAHRVWSRGRFRRSWRVG